MKIMQWGSLAGLLFLLNGCALHAIRSNQPATEQTPPSGLRSTPAPAQPNALPPAALALANDADQAASRQNWAVAARDLERALNIAPHSALLWQRLAAVRFSQGEYHQVEALARKSNALAGGDTAILRMNWRMIAAARAALGDHQGAEEAARRAANIRP